MAYTMSNEAEHTTATRVGGNDDNEVDVFIGQGADRRLVRATLLAVNSATIYVRLPNGNVVRRKVARDVPGWRVGVGYGDLAQPTWTTRATEPSPSTFEYRGFGSAA